MTYCGNRWLGDVEMLAAQFLRDGLTQATVRVPVVALTVAVALERLIPALAATLLSTHGTMWALAAAAGGTALMALHRWLRNELAHAIRVWFFTRVAHIAATRSVLHTGSERLEATFLNAAFVTTRTATDEVPVFFGSLAATLLVLPLVAVFASGWIAFVALPVTAIAVLALLVVRKALLRRNRKTTEHVNALVDSLSLLVRGHLELVAAGRAGDAADIAASRGRDMSIARRDADRLNALAGRLPVLVALVVAGAAAAIWLRDNPGLWRTFAVHALFLGSIVPSFNALGRAWVEATRSLRELAPIVALLQAPAGPKSSDAAPAADPNAPIRFHQVKFAYPDGSTVLSDVSLTWRKNQCVAITGPNGAGKTTLVRLLLRLADPQAGALFVGEFDLREVNLFAWRNSISYLAQRPFLPHQATLREATQWTNPDVSEAELVDMLATLGLHEKLVHLCSHDPLSCRLGALSVGERQRFALARALATARPILILDEPDANLDAAGFEALLSVLPSIAKNRRVVFVAHEPRLLQCADRIVQLAAGGLAHSPSAVTNYRCSSR